MDAAQLDRIAADAMRARGLLPEFSAQAMREARRRRSAPDAPATSATCGASWFSIDNDDSHDLDQLRWPSRWPAARAAAGGHRRRRCPGAGGGAIDGHAGDQHDLGLHRGPRVPDAAGDAVDRPHLAERGPGPARGGGRDGGRADGTVADSEVYRACVRNHAKLAYNARRRLARRRAPGAAARRAGARGWSEQLRLQDARRAAPAAVAAAPRRAERDDEPGAAGVRRRRSWWTCGPTSKNRAKDLIADLMIAANGATARFLAEHGFPSLRRVLQSPRRWERIVALAARTAASCRRSRTRRRSTASSRARRAGRPGGFADLSLAVVKLLGAGEYAASRRRRHGAGPLRPGGERLHALHGAEPPLPGPGHAAPAEGGASPATRRRTRRGAGRHRAALHAAGGQRRTRWSARCARRRRPCCCTAASARCFDAIVTGAAGQGHVRAHRAPAGRGPPGARRRGARRRRRGAACGWWRSTRRRASSISSGPEPGGAARHVSSPPPRSATPPA